MMVPTTRNRPARFTGFLDFSCFITASFGILGEGGRRSAAIHPEASPTDVDIRLPEINNSAILLVFVPVYRVAATGTYSRYAPVAAPCRRPQIRRDLGELFISGNLTSIKKHPVPNISCRRRNRPCGYSLQRMLDVAFIATASYKNGRHPRVSISGIHGRIESYWRTVQRKRGAKGNEQGE
ncbi:hypothetical protein DESC_340016 [Desulfosarcina cetonica]|nr:hypothetical protein DESC_340016 [Desulfosarcina cetonica]